MSWLGSFLRYQFPAVAWGAVIFAASSVPSTKIPSLLLESYDKLIHGGIFFILGILVYRAIRPLGASSTEPLHFNVGRMIVSVGIVILYGATDEVHQAWVPGRSVDILDLTADAVGGLLAALVLYILARWRGRTASA
mgnify:CR=1 FL=1